MSKTVTLIKRRPDLAVEAFQSRLSAAGERLAGAAPLRRCVLSIALPQGYARGDLVFDAVAEAWFDSETGRAVEETERAVRAALAELIDDARTTVLPVRAHVIKDAPVPAHSLKQVEFVRRRAGMDLAAFHDHWRNVHGPIAARMATMPRYEQNHVADAAYAAGARPPCDGIAMMWFASREDMKAGAGTPEFAAILADEPNFLPDEPQPYIITREHAYGAPR